jgi:hypothetical protein
LLDADRTHVNETSIIMTIRERVEWEGIGVTRMTQVFYRLTSERETYRDIVEYNQIEQEEIQRKCIRKPQGVLSRFEGTDDRKGRDNPFARMRGKGGGVERGGTKDPYLSAAVKVDYVALVCYAKVQKTLQSEWQRLFERG